MKNKKTKFIILMLVLSLSYISLRYTVNISVNKNNVQGQELTKTITIKPKQIDDILVNPGIGFTTFNNYNGNVTNYPVSGIAYYRWYWDQIEPTKGNINFSYFDEVLRNAAKAGQKVAFRIMAASDSSDSDLIRIPDWLKQEGCNGFWYGSYPYHFMPDFSDANFLANVHRVIKAFGDRYNGDSRIDHIDVGFVGHWGEWHVYQAESAGAIMPDYNTGKLYIDWWLEAFPNTQIFTLINGENLLSYAVNKGVGWRADGFGGAYQMDIYPKVLQNQGITDAWKKVPVAFETYSTISFLVSHFGLNIDDLINQAVSYHASIFNNKSEPIPAALTDKVNQLAKKLGYRFVVDTVDLPEHIKTNDKISISSVWENIGIAPIYKKYEIAFRLKKLDNTVASIYKSNIDIRNWIPGKYNVDIETDVNVPSGEYYLDVAMVKEGTNESAINLAISEKQPDGWYQLTKIAVE